MELTKKKMTEYIERNKLIKELEFQLEEHGNPDLDHQPIAYGSKLGIMYGLSIAKTFPAEDVVEVVRCEDCAYRDGIVDTCNNIYCRLHDGRFDKDGYCSYGKKEN